MRLSKKFFEYFLEIFRMIEAVCQTALILTVKTLDYYFVCRLSNFKQSLFCC